MKPPRTTLISGLKEEWVKPRPLLIRLLVSIGISEFIIFLIIGLISNQEMKSVLLENSQHQKEALHAEISNLQSFVNFSIGLEERKLNLRISLLSWKLKDLYFFSSDSIESADLKSIQKNLDMDTLNESINIARVDGTIVNSTIEEKLGTHLFINDENSNALSNTEENKKNWVSDEYSFESNTNRLRKYSYEETRDGKYIIQIGTYSKEGTAISNALREFIIKISRERKDVLSLELFLGKEAPFSLTSKRELDQNERNIIKRVFAEKKDSSIISSIVDEEIQTEYIYNEQNRSGLFDGSVIRLKRDLSIDKLLLRQNLKKRIILFSAGLLSLFIILFLNAKLISRPLELISRTAKLVGGGQLDKKIPIKGNLELRELAASFNQMTVDLNASHQKIHAQKEKIESAHKEIKSSITYARYIQTAILPPIGLISRYLAKSFVFYKPKDIVAGDFYWFEVKDDYIFYAAADCTGHGVPGAMLSVVCANALKRSVKEFGIRDPGLILDKTTELVIETFENSEYEVYDGMDISLVRLDLLRYEAAFSGANNPLYIVSENNGELLENVTTSNKTHHLKEYKGDKQPVGKYMFTKPFRTTHIKLKLNDELFVFTDGFADQFGGRKEKKFMYKPFKKLLLSIVNEEPAEQMELISKSFEIWKGDYSQIDDVCVIGVKV